MNGLLHAHSFQQKIRSADPMDLNQLILDLRSRHLTHWRQFSSYHPQDLNSKKFTYHHWCALPTKNTHPAPPSPLFFQFAAYSLRLRVLEFTYTTSICRFEERQLNAIFFFLQNSFITSLERNVTIIFSAVQQLHISHTKKRVGKRTQAKPSNEQGPVLGALSQWLQVKLKRKH
eukprot:1156586-Pelagomonas_calceolata.AAC.3